MGDKAKLVGMTRMLIYLAERRLEVKPDDEELRGMVDDWRGVLARMEGSAARRRLVWGSLVLAAVVLAGAAGVAVLLWGGLALAGVI